MTESTETTINFSKTAGVLETSAAKQYVWRLRAARIPHLVQPAEGGNIRVSVQPNDLKDAVALQPKPHISGSQTNETSRIHPRVLIGIALGIFSGAIIGNFLGGGHAYFALLCVLCCIAILETNARRFLSTTKS
jgi:hypothetical protein